MRKNVFAGSMLLLACVALVACTTGSGEEVQYVKIGQNLCSFLAEGNQPLEIDVKASPAEWTVEMGATWVKAERTDDRVLTVTVEDNGMDSRKECRPYGNGRAGGAGNNGSPAFAGRGVRTLP